MKIKVYDELKIICFIIASSCLIFFAQLFSSGVNLELVGKRQAILSGLSLALTLRLYQYEKKAVLVFMMHVILLISPLFIVRICKEVLTAEVIVETLAFAVVYTSIYLILKLFAKNIEQKSKILNITLNCFLIILSFVEIFIISAYWGYFILSKACLSPDIILTLFQTNPSEASAWWSAYGGNDKGVAIGTFVAAIVFFLYKLNRLVKPKTIVRKGYEMTICLLAIIVVVMGVRSVNNSLEQNTVKNVTQALKSYQEYVILCKEQNNMNIASLNLEKKRGGLYILVIGESETRDHMGVYGYKRSTTPWLSSMKTDPSVIVFENAYSNHTHTVPVLTYALTEKNSYNNLTLNKSISLVTASNSAQFKTVWLSNQVKIGAYDTPVAAIASSAKEQFWLNTNIGATTETKFFDGKLVDKLQQINLNGDVLVVIHLMGSHGSYQNRYPKEFKKFNAEVNRDVDNYDNTVLYTDSILKNIYETVKKSPNFQTLIYCADHGDDVDKNIGHEATKFTFSMARIPLVILSSEKFRNEYKIEWLALQQHKNSKFTNDLLYNLQCAVMGIKTMNAKENENIASPKYDANRNFLTLHGKQSLAEDNRI